MEQIQADTNTTIVDVNGSNNISISLSDSNDKTISWNGYLTSTSINPNQNKYITYTTTDTYPVTFTYKPVSIDKQPILEDGFVLGFKEALKILNEKVCEDVDFSLEDADKIDDLCSNLLMKLKGLDEGIKQENIKKLEGMYRLVNNDNQNREDELVF